MAQLGSDFCMRLEADRHISEPEQMLTKPEICCCFGLCDTEKNKRMEGAQEAFLAGAGQPTTGRGTEDHIPLSKTRRDVGVSGQGRPRQTPRR